MVSMKSLKVVALSVAVMLGAFTEMFACTGISLKAKDGSRIVARTMEWGTFVMDSRYVVIPRGYTQTALTPEGANGMKIVAKYGYVGIGVLDDNLIAEGVNEKGVMGELFYFPNFGKYEEYNKAHRETTLSDAQLLSWVLGNFASIDEMIANLDKIHVVGYGRGFGAAHFNLADASGRHVVLEYIDGKAKVYENKIGVITNAPSFDWHMTNLGNYMNVFAGAVEPREVVPGLTVKSLGMGSASLGLPGDLTPPSRFVRAAFYVHTARPQATGEQSIMQAFQILHNFDIPAGSEYKLSEEMPELLSATQWTAAVDLTNLKFYYHTAWNNKIRCIDVKTIDFGKVKYQTRDLDTVKRNEVEHIQIK